MIRLLGGRDIPTRVLILSIVVFVGAVTTVLTLNAQGTNFETQLRVFLNYGVPAVIGLFTLSRVERVSDKVKTIEKNTNGNLSALIEKVGPVNQEGSDNEGR